jgi:hypothetical protein
MRSPLGVINSCTMHFNFVASDQFDLSSFGSVENFIEQFPDFQTVWLNDEEELKILLDLMEIHDCHTQPLSKSEYEKYWDLSSFKLPELDEKQYEEFYARWIEMSKRENSFDEYASLIFLKGLATEWNRLKFRLIVK